MLTILLIIIIVSIFVIGYNVKKQTRNIQELEGIIGKKK